MHSFVLTAVIKETGKPMYKKVVKAWLKQKGGMINIYREQLYPYVYVRMHVFDGSNFGIFER